MTKTSSALALGSAMVIALWPSFASQAATAPNKNGIVIEGSLDCGQWVKSRADKTSVAIESYLVGVLNGMAFGYGFEFWLAKGTTVSREAVYLWMDNYCTQHPLEQMFSGAAELYWERSGVKP